MNRYAVLALVLGTSTAHAWTIGSQLDYTGCHERITTTAFRATRSMFDTAPVIVPTRDESALIDAVQFVPPNDFKQDLAAMALLLGVRDNDLKGHNPLDSLQLVEVHGNPATQEEHCIRNAEDDGTPGDTAALDRCRAFIHTRISEAIAGAGGRWQRRRYEPDGARGLCQLRRSHRSDATGHVRQARPGGARARGWLHAHVSHERRHDGHDRDELGRLRIDRGRNAGARWTAAPREHGSLRKHGSARGAQLQQRDDGCDRADGDHARSESDQRAEARRGRRVDRAVPVVSTRLYVR